MVGPLFSQRNNPPDFPQQETEPREGGLDMPGDIYENIERKRQRVLQELAGKPYAELFADAVAQNLTERALASYRLDPNRERF